ncbi:alpha/beta hydrolase family protein [Kitasatospora sp. NBC_00240]|uniref:alpha/beta hydrolase n=1 Tax=Kitasatospora sp. NBC_00240 TaxID=2903567 RepID=UPI002259F361|nr:alpha/beta hydrolase [Kitasatospora sp. NBC_00240]MCX5213670.1 alpha/beta hydrolase family protein [Kitasatospora sp. NBC_00240]
METKTLYDVNLNNLLTARFAYESLASAFAKHIEAWQTTVVDRLERSRWTGSTADQVHGDLRVFAAKLKAADQELVLVGSALAEAHRSIALAQSKLIQVMDDAKAAGITVKPDGSMSWNNDRDSSSFAGPGAANKAEALSLRLRDALSEADHADQEISRRLRHFVDNATSGTGLDGATAEADRKANQGRLDIPDAKATPEQVKAWWNGLTPGEQEQLIQNHPEEIGNRDGIPAVGRDEANRLTLKREHDRLQDEFDKLGDEPVERLMPGEVVYAESLEHKQWREKHADLEEKLKGINAIQGRLDDTVTADHPKSYLLAFDTEGKGHAAVAINNPDTADNVVTYVPGTGARLGSIPGDIGRSDSMVGAARSADSTKTTSSITWVGYDAPQNIFPQAADDSYADGARDKLHSFETGLRATHEGQPSHNTILGHSYGSTTVGYALRDKGLPVDDVIFVGSPGVGVDNAKDLHVDPNHVYAGRGDADAIEWALPENPANYVRDGVSEFGTKISNGFGALNPYSGFHSEADNHLAFGRDPANGHFGGREIPTDPGTEHSDYWQGASLDAMGNIIAGK